MAIEAGQEEKWLVEERGDYHDSAPANTVIMDAGWSKCSHKHSYNVKSVVGIIIGKETGNLLHLWVRNKPVPQVSLTRTMVRIIVKGGK